MIETINNFVSRFETSINLDENSLLKKQNRLFLVDENLKRLASKDFFYAGTCLGKTEDGEFFPSFSLLRMIAERKANKVVVDEKTEWLFICGRDIFKQGVIRLQGSRRKGDYTLVLNRRRECLGFGKILFDLSGEREGAVISNIFDLGDFLRRER
jgi:ribosome biogenesis protein Nip4